VLQKILLLWDFFTFKAIHSERESRDLFSRALERGGSGGRYLYSGNPEGDYPLEREVLKGRGKWEILVPNKQDLGKGGRFE